MGFFNGCPNKNNNKKKNKMISDMGSAVAGLKIRRKFNMKCNEDSVDIKIIFCGFFVHKTISKYCGLLHGFTVVVYIESCEFKFVD